VKNVQTPAWGNAQVKGPQKLPQAPTGRPNLRKSWGVAPGSGFRTRWKNRGSISPLVGAFFSLSWAPGGAGRREGGHFGSPHFHEPPNPRRGVKSTEADIS